MIERELLALDALEHKVSCQSVRHFTLRWVTPDLSTMHIALQIGTKRFDAVLLHHLSTNALHELESVAIDIEGESTLQHVPLLLDLGPHSRVAREL